MKKEEKDLKEKPLEADDLANETLNHDDKPPVEEEEKLTLEDKLDNVMDGVQDFFYGERKDFTNDIPATMVNSQGIRKINKVQTRRNIHKRLFGKKGPIILLIIIGVGVLIGLIITLIEKLLLL